MSAVADEELGPKLTFEIADLLRKRRSGDVKSLCRSTEMQFFSDGNEVDELPEFHVIDPTAASDSPGLPHLGDKSWTSDEDKG